MFTLNSFLNVFDSLKFSEEKMPVLFIGHGNPMNAIEKNEFHNSWIELGKRLPKPKAILTVSAHWLTRGVTKVTAMERPQTIHDFGGFPQELYVQQYPAYGAPALAEETRKHILKTVVELDYEWGLDHGTWSFLLPMYPQAEIPVYQLSIDYTQAPQFHYDLAKELRELKKKGVLIIGSGNIVHNLRAVNFSGQLYDWAIEFDEKIKQLILAKNHLSIINYKTVGSSAQLAVPTNDHYLPLLYSIALQEKNETVQFFNEQMDLGSVSMRSLIIH